MRLLWIRSCFLLASALVGRLAGPRFRSDHIACGCFDSIVFPPLALDGNLEDSDRTTSSRQYSILFLPGFGWNSQDLDSDQITSRHVRIRSHFRLGFGLALALNGRLAGPRFRSDHSSRCVLIHVAFRHAMPHRAASRLFIEE